MNLKSIMLGAAAAAAAVTGAQAADLPVAPEPVDYVRVCDAFGARFFYIPGTETCLRVGGRVRVDFYFNDFGDEPNNWKRASNGTSTRARGYLYLDARTNTEYGLVRAYTTMIMTRDSSGSSYDLDKAFIQFGNFTFGRAGSQYDFFTGNAYNQVGKNWSDTNSWVAAYTAAFGNGVSATISLEDGTYRRTGTGFAGHRYPDLVAALKVDQGWGSAKVMAALHEARLANAASDAKVGYGIGAGVTIKLPSLGKNDTISFQAQYADGALSYAMGEIDGAQDVVFSGGRTRTSKAWSLSGGLLHYWTDNITSAIDVSYADVDAPFTGTDFNRWSVSGNAQWEPVSGLIFGAELGYASTDFNRASRIKDKDTISGMLRVQRTF